ncbi:hypothetical protein DL239_20600 [Sedimentitalea sp. CY04]|uniref:peptidylprolyl isomerase n=1 Tax=Parasedimentitalea denitrificans TaxID=2211118 RepID=A0ABX0WCD6_9RHOB|nr:peptidylprolyl isomerase [Sedimentitalea sp. CY04]NIZ63370.1 hypothetical protein [Sedimentitalea sp. CY04]
MIARISKEPLVHFLLIGGLIFATFSLMDDSPAKLNSQQITISKTDLVSLSARFESVWKRTPQPEEMQSMTEDLIRERVLVNAALDLGMDQGDAVIERRLRQKMEFFAASIAEAIEPEDGELVAFFIANAEDYQESPQLALEQVYLGEKANSEDSSEALSALRTGIDPAQLRSPSLLPERFEMTAVQVLDSSFGTGFAGSLINLPIGEWAGPVQSGYGVHLVRLSGKSASTLPPLDQVMPQVLADWQRAKRQDVLDQYYQTLRQGYEIVLPMSDDAS